MLDVRLSKKRHIFIHQTKLINKIIREFSPKIKGIEKDTPMSVHEHVIIPDENEGKSMLKRYQHGVGSFLYLVKLSRPDLTNSVRELSKCMTKCNIASYNQMLRVISYLKMYNNYGINLKWNQKMNENIDLKCYVDSDWGGDTVNRKSISGWIITFNGNPIMWRSKHQSIVDQ